MSKESNKKLTLAEFIANKKERKKNKPFRGTYYSKTEDCDIEFKKCDEEFFFYLMDKFPNAFSEKKEDMNIPEIIHAANRLVFECVMIENRSLKDKEVQQALEVDLTNPQEIVNNTAKAFLEDFTERIELFGEILAFSGFGNNPTSKVEEIKN